ncbi:MAG TPA: universal stress protein [Blastocatellia bacterium]|nr:universal stress protein [Blastocatellia bacterium]
MKVLLAIDSSELSEAVASEVERRPWPPETVVCVLTVIDLLAFTAAVGYLEPFIKSENEAAKALVESVAERLARRNLQTTTLTVEGYPGTTIVEQAEKWGADFVFVGSHGHSGVVRFLLGSIAKAVVQNAPCSVEIVRHPKHDEDHPDHHKDGEESGRIRVLLATDGSEYSAAAARSVAARPWPDESEIRIVSVAEPIAPAADPWYAAAAIAKRVREDDTKRSEEAVSAARAIVASTGLKIETAVLEGSPKRQIVEDSKKWGAHLVVVGSHGRRGLTRYFLGSVSEAVAMHAHCSVEVIRDRVLLAKP